MGKSQAGYQPAGTVLIQLSYNCAYELLNALNNALGGRGYKKKKKKKGKKGKGKKGKGGKTSGKTGGKPKGKQPKGKQVGGKR
jgi:hypothetical protein